MIQNPIILYSLLPYLISLTHYYQMLYFFPLSEVFTRLAISNSIRPDRIRTDSIRFDKNLILYSVSYITV